MGDKKYIFITVGIVLGVFAFLFWIFFAVISYRRANYGIEGLGRTCGSDGYELYASKDGVKFYSACYEKLNMREERFIFVYKHDLKQYIRDGSIYSILQKADIYKWRFSRGIQTDYTFSPHDDYQGLMVTKCTIDGEDTYYIHGSQSSTFCEYLY